MSRRIHPAMRVDLLACYPDDLSPLPPHPTSIDASLKRLALLAGTDGRCAERCYTRVHRVPRVPAGQCHHYLVMAASPCSLSAGSRYRTFDFCELVSASPIAHCACLTVSKFTRFCEAHALVLDVFLFVAQVRVSAGHSLIGRATATAF